MVITDSLAQLDATRHRVTLVPNGEIDAGNVDDLSSSIHEALLSGAHEIDLDLTGVPFMDTAALEVLRNARDTLVRLRRPPLHPQSHHVRASPPVPDGLCSWKPRPARMTPGPCGLRRTARPKGGAAPPEVSNRGAPPARLAPDGTHPRHRRDRRQRAPEAARCRPRGRHPARPLARGAAWRRFPAPTRSSSARPPR